MTKMRHEQSFLWEGNDATGDTAESSSNANAACYGQAAFKTIRGGFAEGLRVKSTCHQTLQCVGR